MDILSLLYGVFLGFFLTTVVDQLFVRFRPFSDTESLRRIRAQLGGYFWLPCPVCGRMFGGNELPSWPDHESSIFVGIEGSVTRGKSICPTCTEKGEGCRSWASAPERFAKHCPDHNYGYEGSAYEAVRVDEQGHRVEE